MILPELPLSRAAVDRAAELRTRPGLVADLLADPATRVLLVRDGTVPIRTDRADGSHGTDGTHAPALDLRSPHGWGDAADADHARWMFLGEDPEGVRYLARASAQDEVLPPRARGPQRSDAGTHPDVEAAADGGHPPMEGGEGATIPVAGTEGAVTGDDGPSFATLREVGHRLSARDAGLATTAVALAAWHARHPRCPRCGGTTSVVESGWARRCDVDGSEHYPRTDPAIIVAVVDERDRILLGHSATWAPGRYSTLAGFVEAGEPAEAAVRREVMEESGVRVDEVEYRGSQPWPFPASLMLGYRARARGGPVTPDGVEMTDARWFTRQEVADEVRAGRLVLPGRSSIAHALVAEWYGGPLPERDGTAF
ncbi:NAD(+) diphosphatase [Cellulomonas endophytica]|uniref:NAD(+) diphosphatase n=1 Tax=Cellulomonas endophytica TaxID=2494735 RepID=UPI001010EB90|nr:NAD(+) diphosphatase [Cellulomonas endophytica]